MIRSHRLTACAIVAATLVAPPAPCPAAAFSPHAIAAGEAGAPGEGASETGSPGPWRRFWRGHGWRIVTAFAIDQAADIYEDRVGASTNPLLFQDAPFFDKRINERVSGPRKPRGYIEEHGLETLRYGVPLALIGIGFGDRSNMGRDLAGFVETFYTNRGLTSLVKNIVGRERPPLDLAGDRGAGPKEREALDDDPGNHESFPSGHASGSFAFASYLERAIARKVGPRSTARVFSFTGLYGVAGYIGWSRIRRDKHFLTDVVAGAALGTAVSRHYYRASHPGEFAGKSRRRSAAFSIYPPAPVPGGAMISVGIRMPEAVR